MPSFACTRCNGRGMLPLTDAQRNPSFGVKTCDNCNGSGSIMMKNANQNNDPLILAEDHEQGDDSVLGPVYYTARRLAEQLMRGVEDEPIKTIIDKKILDPIRDEFYDYIETHIKSDLENNLQGYLKRMVDETVHALLTGEAWALQRYTLTSNHDGETVRAAVCKHGGDTLLMKRIEDLEKQLTHVRDLLRHSR